MWNGTALNPVAFLFLLSLSLAFTGPAFGATHTVHVNDGSVPDLVVALEEVAGRLSSDSTVIILSGEFVLEIGHEIPTIFRGDVAIEGGSSAAVITAEEGWEGPLFEIEPSAKVRLFNLEISDIKLEPSELISNRGELEISRVQFKNNAGYTFCFNFGRCTSLAGRLITNFESGRLSMDGVSFIDSGANAGLFGALLGNFGDAVLSNIQLYLSGFLPASPFANEGTLRIVNGSFFARQLEGFPQRSGLVAGTSIVGNSIIVGYPSEWCENVQSLGHNVVDNPDCVLNGEHDLVGIQADLIFAPVEADWNPQGKELLTNALVPLARSVAVDSGASENCAAGSLLGAERIALDGDGDGVAGCDRGAVEREPSTVDKGGINGLYFNPNADGHYLYIAETTFTTLVMWTTFDNQGRQAWIFGIGDEVSPTGRFVTQAYINRNGAVRLNGTLRPADAVPWGSLEVRMQSCNQGRLIFDSDQPGFGSGEFPIRRLAFVDQLECVEEP